MASVRKRVGKKGVSWVIDYKEPPTDEYPKGKRVRLSGFKTKKSAEQELGKRVSLIGENRYLDVKKEYTTMLGQLIDDYSENHKHQASFQTAKFHFLRRIREHFGEKTLLANITYKDLETYRNYLRNTPTKFEHLREASSINAELSCLNHLFTKAREWDMIEISPFNNGKSLRLKVDNERTRFLAEDEIESLLALSPVWLQHIIIFCIHSGARRKEAINLKWYQIRNGHIYFEKTKTNKKRQVPIDIDLQELLDSLRGKPSKKVVSLMGKAIQKSSENTGLVFSNSGQKHSIPKLEKAFRVACERANIPFGIKTPDGVTFHTLRHTFGSQLAIKGISIKMIQELLGHKNIQMTMRYAHLAEDTKKEAIKALNGLTSKTVSQFGTNNKIVKNTNSQPIENTPNL